MNAKDFYIEYMEANGREPTEEEWLAYYDEEMAKAEAIKDLWYDRIEKGG